MKEKNKIPRRGFLKTTAAGAAGVLCVPTIAATSKYNDTEKESKIIYRTLGRTGIKVPIISSGAIPVENDNLAKAILKSGIIHIDTARSYHKGKNEEVLGKVMKDFKREDYIIATKVYEKRDKETGLFTDEVTVESILEQFNASLEALGMEYVDILYLHAISRKECATHPAVLEAFKQIKAEGKAKYLGVSTHRNAVEIIEAAIDSNFYDVVLTLYNYHYPDIKEAVAKAAKAGLGIVAMKVFAGNMEEKEEDKKPVNKKAALKWTLQDKNVHTAILRIDTFEILEEFWGVMNDLELTDQEKKDLQLADTSNSLFCQGCNSCIENCQKNLPIPELMRAYMYAHGYKHSVKAQELVQSLELPEKLCSDCNICTTKCVKNFDLARRIENINRLRKVPTEFLV